MEIDRFGFLVGQLREREYEVRQTAIAGLVQMGQGVVVPLIGELDRSIQQFEGLKRRYSNAYNRDDYWQCCHTKDGIVIALGEIGDPTAVEPLINLNWWEHGGLFESHLAETLGKLGDPRAIDTLLKLLRSPDVGAKANAAEALGKFRRDDIPDALGSALWDITSPEIAKNATSSLRQMNEDPWRLKKDKGEQALGDRTVPSYVRWAIAEEMFPRKFLFLYRGTRMQDGPMLGREFWFTDDFSMAWREYTGRHSGDGERLRGRAGVWLYDATLLKRFGIDGHRRLSGSLETVLVNPQRDYGSNSLPIDFMNYYQLFRTLFDKLARVTPIRGEIPQLEYVDEVVETINGLQIIMPTLKEVGSERFITTFIRDLEGILPAVVRMIEGNLTNEGLMVLKTTRPVRIQDLQVGFVLAGSQPDEVVDKMVEYQRKYQAGII